MNYVYFRNTEGRYYYGVPVVSEELAIRVAGELGAVAPQVMVTDSGDCAVLELRNGSIIHPAGIELPPPDLGLLELLPRSESDYYTLLSYQADHSLNSELFIKLECLILASAARDRFDLHRIGWRRPGEH